jgi:murein DD-endopeptidase MepM/ murein hydrolase activator NlpD
MAIAGCPRCASTVALHEGVPFVTPAGAVQLWHRACWALRDQPLETAPVVAVTARVETELPRARARLPRVIATSVAAAAVLGIVFTQLRTGDAAPTRELANVEIRSAEQLVVESKISTSDSAPLFYETKDEQRWPMPEENGTPLDLTFATLGHWIHPVAGSPEHMPPLVTRHFGAQRIGIERAECGAGHCGVDLDGPRGNPLVAVADGVVVRVERSERGADGRSGRYIRLRHDDGTLTAYMHMDDVAEVQVGDRVHAGQYVGTLGATAVFSAPPHLHFSLEVPNHPGSTGDTVDTHYVDPAPFLVRATIVKSPERRRVIKPAM